MKLIKQRISIFFIILLATGMSLCCGGCSFKEYVDKAREKRLSEGPPKGTKERTYIDAVDEFFEALDAGDAEAIREMFSLSVQQQDTDLDEQIEKLIALYPGPTDINTRNGYLTGGEYHANRGDMISSLESTFMVVSNNTYYWCFFKIMYENDIDANQIGLTQVIFCTADERCIRKYDRSWKWPTEDGLIVFGEKTLDCEIRPINGEPYQYTSNGNILNEEEVVAFLNKTTSYKAFVERFGEPNAKNVFYIYELLPEENQPRYLVLFVSESDDEIYEASVADQFEWVHGLWDDD